MKAKRCAVFIESTSKDKCFYQVALTAEQMEYVLGLLVQLHGGKISVREEKFTSMSFIEIKKRKVE